MANEFKAKNGVIAPALLLRGTSSNNITLQPSASAGTVTYTLPTTDGTTGQVLSTNGSGTLSWAASGSITVSDDTTTNATRYLVFEDITSGSSSTINVSSTKLSYNPSTGVVTSTGFSGAHTGTIGATNPSTGAFTTLSASSTVSGTGFSTYLASPPSIGSTAANSGAFTTLTANNTVTFTQNTGATSTTTGTLRVTGGVGISERLYAGSIQNTPIGSVTASSGAFTTLSATGAATFSAGTVGAPSITTSGDSNTGIYFPAADTIAFVEGGAEIIRIDSSGSVGIGLTNPSTFGKLVVASTGTPGAAYASILSGVNVYNTAWESTLYLGLARTDVVNNNATAGFRIKNVGADATGSYLAFEAGSSATGANAPPTTYTERMRLTSAGNVGIGTTTERSRLNVAGTSGTGAQVEITNTSSSQYALGGIALRNSATANQSNVTIGTGVRDADGTDSYFAIFKADTNNNFVSTLANYDLTDHFWDFYTNGGHRMRIDSAGRVAINTSSSLTRTFTVAGDVETGNAIVTGRGVSTGDVAIELGSLRTGDGNVYVDLHAQSGQDYNARILRNSGVNGDLQLFQTGTGFYDIWHFGNGNIRLATNNLERLRIDSAGNVGIGTAGGDYSRTWRLVAKHDQNAVTQFGVLNATVGTSAQARISRIGGTGNSFCDWNLSDNNGAPFDQYVYGSAVTDVYWSFGGTTKFQINKNGPIGLTPDVWHYSMDTSGGYKNRLFFANNSRTYFGSQAGYEWRSAADASLMQLGNDGRLAVGVGVGLEDDFIVGKSNASVAATLRVLSDTTNHFPMLIFRHRNAANNATPTNSVMGQITWDGLTSNGTYATMASIYVDVGTVTTTSTPGNLVFGTTTSGAGSASEKMRIAASGALGFAGANYGTAGQVLTSAGSGSAPTWQTNTSAFVFVIDAGASVITTGVKGDLVIPFACTITEWTLVADVSGSIVIDIWKDTYANYPATVADTITASAKPTITSAIKNTSSTLTGWTTSIAANDILRFNVDSITSCKRVTLVLKVSRS